MSDPCCNEIRKLLDIITDDCDDMDVRGLAAERLWTHTWGDKAEWKMTYMMELGAAERLMRVVQDGSCCVALTGRVCNIFQNLACEGARRTRLIDAGAAPVLLRMFTAEPPGDLGCEVTSHTVWHSKARGPAAGEWLSKL